MNDSQPTRPKHPYKCPTHNTWMRKGQCEQCLMARDRIRKEQEQITGVNKPEIIIKKI